MLRRIEIYSIQNDNNNNNNNNNDKISDLRKNQQSFWILLQK